MNNLMSIISTRFLLLVLAQILVFSHINFLGYINPMVYILFVILYPIKNDRMVFLLLSFLIGITIDMFSDSGGMHAAACTTIAYVRPFVLKFCFGAVYEHQSVKFQNVEFGSRLTYISILTVIHHLVLFMFEIFDFSRILFILEKTLYSSIFTILLCVLLSIIFSKKGK